MTCHGRTLRLSPSAAISMVIFERLDEVAQATAPLLAAGRVALSGGATYASLFALWARLVARPCHAEFFPVDERAVPLQHPDSNWGAALRLLLEALGRTQDRRNHAASAGQYRRRLSEAFGAGIPVFDTVFLGVGEDGHTASLFAGGGWEQDLRSVALSTRSPKPPARRITLAPAVLAAARQLVVIVHGQAKHRVATRLCAGDMALPITRVLSLRAESTVYIHRPLISVKRARHSGPSWVAGSTPAQTTNRPPGLPGAAPGKTQR